MVHQQRQAPIVELMLITVNQSEVLQYVFAEALRCKLAPMDKHLARKLLLLKVERVQHQEDNVIVVAIHVNQLLKVVVNTESFQHLLTFLFDTEQS